MDLKHDLIIKAETNHGLTVQLYGIEIRQQTPDHLGIAIVQDKLVQFKLENDPKQQPQPRIGASNTAIIVGEPIHFDDVFPKNVQEDEDQSHSLGS